MRLSDLARHLRVERLENFSNVELTGISADSRELRGGEVFIAVKGSSADGHDFITEARSRGAAALIVDRSVGGALPTIVVSDTTAAAAHAAKAFFGDPAGDLRLVGVTGTNGKTSTAFLLQSILHVNLGPTGIIGTVGFGAAGDLQAATHTTPGAIELYRIIADFRRRGCAAVVMEVSSHAADQDRIAGLEFDVAVFTNVSRDHLDYHGTMEQYVAAKERFVRTLLGPGRAKDPGVLVYNADDETVSGAAGRFGGETVSFGFSREARFRIADLAAGMDGTRFDLEVGGRRISVSLPLLGRFSAYNAAAAAAAAAVLDVSPEAIKAGLEATPMVPGRFQVVSEGKGPVVIVDYAHTPDALESLLTFCRQLGPERIVTVFGCGGDRDRGKRPMMGRIAGRLSDVVFVTSDNPRSEDPAAIIEEILEGMEGMPRPHVIEDRGEAIARAVREAGDRDMIVVAGKGHERVQIVGERRIPFSDADAAREALGAREVEHHG